MPKVQWSKLPPALRDHLLDRLRDRQITVEDLYQLKLWRESEPDAPDGDWFKDFGSFKICGRRLLSPQQAPLVLVMGWFRIFNNKREDLLYLAPPRQLWPSSRDLQAL